MMWNRERRRLAHLGLGELPEVGPRHEDNPEIESHGPPETPSERQDGPEITESQNEGDTE